MTVHASSKVKASDVWDGMTRKDFDRIVAHFDRIATALGLAHWDITVEVLPEPDEDNLATTRVTHDSHIASICVAKTLHKEARKTIEITVIHELLHIYVEPMLSPVTRSTGLPAIIGAPTAIVFETFLDAAKETMIDTLATALRPHLPRYPKVK